MDRGLLVLGTVAGLLLLSRRASTPKPPRDDEWLPAMLTEYHPDAPESEREMEGGSVDRAHAAVITVQQHRKDKAKYSYVSVSSDTVLRGESVPYGARIYFGAYPDLVFRLVDTGGRFRGDKKRIRKPGYEPFDIATDYGSDLGFSLKETMYRLDRKDIIKPNTRQKKTG